MSIQITGTPIGCLGYMVRTLLATNATQLGYA